MATQKVLSIILKTVDLATRPIMGTLRVVQRMGRGLVKVNRIVAKSAVSVLKTVTSLKAGIIAFVGFLAARGVLRFIDGTLKKLDELGKTARRLGTSVGDLDALSFAAGQSGIQFNQLVSAGRFLLKNVQDVRDGTGEAARALENLGISVVDLVDPSTGNMRSLAELLVIVSEGLSNTDDQALRNNAAMKLLGRSGSQLLTLIDGGTEGLRDLLVESQKFGRVTQEQTDMAEDYVDALGRLERAWDNLKNRVILTITPLLTSIINKAAEFLAVLPDIIETAREKIIAAIGGDEAIRNEFEILFDLILNFLRVQIEQGGKVLAVSVLAAIDTMIAIATPELKAGITKAIVDSIVAVMTFLPDIIARHITSANGFRVNDPIVKFVKDYFTVSAGIVRLGGEGLNREIDAFFGVGSNLDAGVEFSTLRVRQITAAWTELKVQSRQAGSSLVDQIDNMLGITATLAERMADAADRYGDFNKQAANTPTGPIERFVESLREGARQFVKAQQSVEDFVTDSVGKIANSISTEITSAIFAVIDGTKSFEEAFRVMTANILRMIAQMIIQFLILQAIRGVLSSFGGGSTPTTPDVSFGEAIGISGASRGGGVRDYKVQRFDSGGPVFGPRLPFDTIPAMLRNGEFVMNPDAVQRLGMNNLARENNRFSATGSLGGGGGTAPVIVNQTNHFGGSGGRLSDQDARDVREATKLGVSDGLRRDVTFRNTVRKIIQN